MIFHMFTPIIGKHVQFDEHIFQVGFSTINQVSRCCSSLSNFEASTRREETLYAND